MVKLCKTVPISHKQTELGDRLTAELSGQRSEGRPTLSLHASEIEDNDLSRLRALSLFSSVSHVRERAS